MRKCLPFLLLLLSSYGFSQETQEAEQSKKDNPGIDTIKVAQKEPILLLDEDDVDFANKVPLETFMKDSLIFHLTDDPEASRMDSIWQQELLKSINT